MKQHSNPITKHLLKNRAVTMRNRKQDYSRKLKHKGKGYE